MWFKRIVAKMAFLFSISLFDISFSTGSTGRNHKPTSSPYLLSVNNWKNTSRSPTCCDSCCFDSVVMKMMMMMRWPTCCYHTALWCYKVNKLFQIQRRPSLLCLFLSWCSPAGPVWYWAPASAGRRPPPWGSIDLPLYQLVRMLHGVSWSPDETPRVHDETPDSVEEEEPQAGGC